MSIIVITVILFIRSPLLTITTLGGMIPLIAFTGYYMRKIKEISRACAAEKAKMSVQAEETLAHIRTVKAFASEDDEFSKFSKANDKVMAQGHYKVIWNAAQQFIAQLSLYGCMMIIIFVAQELYSQGKITIGEISTYFFYLLFYIMMMLMFMRVTGSLMMILGTVDQISIIMKHKPKINSTGGDKFEDVDQIEGRIDFQDVKFTYPTKQEV